MALKQAWDDRKIMIILFHNLQSSLKDFKDYAEELNKFKIDILDDPTRKKEMKKLIDEDPDWDLSKILNKYNQFKKIYDYLIGE